MKRTVTFLFAASVLALSACLGRPQPSATPLPLFTATQASEAATATPGWRFTIGQDTLKVGSQQVSVNAHTVTCGPNDEYGLMLRLQPDASNSGFDGYNFKLRCSGQASFEMITGIQRKTIVDWTGSPAIKTGTPADNTPPGLASGSER